MSTTGTPEVRSLGEDVLIVICDVAARMRTAPKLESLIGATPSPLMSLRLFRKDGGTRVLWAFRRPADRDPVMRVFAGILASSALIEIGRSRRYPAIDLPALWMELEPASQVSFIAALAGIWSSAFKLRRSRTFLRAMQGLVGTMGLRPPAALVETRLPGRQALATTVLPPPIGEIQAIYVLAATGIEYLARKWRHEKADGGRKPLLHIVVRDDLGADDMLLIVGAGGVCVRRPVVKARMPSLSAWWRAKSGSAARLREFILHALAEVSPHAALEFQQRTPLRPRSLGGRGDFPSATIELAFAGPSGLFVAGWFRDPAGFIGGLEAEDDVGVAHAVAWHQFPMSLVFRGKKTEVTAFVGFAATYKHAAILQPRFRLKLATGAGHELIPRPQSSDPAARRALILKAVPARHLTDAMMADCMAPALADVQRAFLGSRGQPTSELIGEPLARPAISVVIPLYRNLEFLPAQVAAFALDPTFRESAEVIYVLDSPEQAVEVRQHLLGLNLLYGVPFTLLVMRRNAGYAPACNAGARAARGELVAMVNSDVIPARPGWLPLLGLRLARSPKLGAVGPKLLFDDGSIQHAGMYFARNHFGRWLNHHFHKGMPREFPPATVERSVPAVTGACLVTRRDLFEAVGGFSENYVIGDYEDSDLCLKIRAKGHDVAYVPAAELYHFERQSIRRSDDYMQGTADRHNAWLHGQRWGEAMQDLMENQLRSHPALRAAA